MKAESKSRAGRVSIYLALSNAAVTALILATPDRHRRRWGNDWQFDLSNADHDLPTVNHRDSRCYRSVSGNDETAKLDPWIDPECPRDGRDVFSLLRAKPNDRAIPLIRKNWKPNGRKQMLLAYRVTGRLWPH